jgi:hypothetical protein
VAQLLIAKDRQKSSVSTTGSFRQPSGSAARLLQTAAENEPSAKANSGTRSMKREHDTNWCDEGKRFV